MADPREAVVRKYRAKMIEHKTMEAQVKKGALDFHLDFPFSNAAALPRAF